MYIAQNGRLAQDFYPIFSEPDTELLLVFGLNPAAPPPTETQCQPSASNPWTGDDIQNKAIKQTPIMMQHLCVIAYLILAVNVHNLNLGDKVQEELKARL